MENASSNLSNNTPLNIGEKNFKIIESTKKVYYFSKLALDYESCLNIIKFIKSIKENVLHAILESLKYIVQGNILYIKYN